MRRGVRRWHRNTPLETRLWSDVERQPSGCWEFMGYRDARGYGNIRMAGHLYRTHRLAWELVFGEPLGDRIICHRCDNPPCCNPMHIYAGTTQQNSEDRLTRGRGRGNETGGEQHYRTRLTADEVHELRQLRSEGWLLRELSERYGMSIPGIGAITTGRTWKTADWHAGRPA